MNEGLCQHVRAAFAGVKLGHGVGLQEAQGLDDYEDAQTCARYRASDEKEDWSRIPASELNRCNSSLTFFDAEGMRFHLPAFLIAQLKGQFNFDLAFALTQLSEHNKSQFELLSSAQRQAVRAFLFHLIHEGNDQWDHPHIKKALREYWI